MYSWNHLRPSLTAATSSIDRVPSVLRVYGRPARAAARATESSPSGSAMRVNPVGARTSGSGSGRPSSVVEGSGTPTPRRIRGWNPMRWKAAEFSASVRSSSAPPSM